MAGRRLSSLFNKFGGGSSDNKGSNGGADDATSDNVSVTSDSTGTSASDDRNKLFSFRFNSDPSDEDLDNGFKLLFGDPDILEKRCQYASFGKKYDENESSAAEESNTEDSKELLDRFKPIHRRKINEVPEVFFDPTFDPVLQCLLEVQSWTKERFNENFMNKIEDIDANRDVVSSELAVKINANYDGLVDCMREVHSIDIDLSRAIIQVDGSRRKLKGSIDITSQGSLKVVKAKKLRDQLELVVERAKGLKFIKELFKTMVQNLTTGELGRAAVFSRSVLQNINTRLYDDYDALKNISAEVAKHISLIRQKTDKALMLLCNRRFSTNDYTNIINSFIILDDLSATLDVDISNHSSDDSNLTEFDRLGCIDGLSSRIVHFQMLDLESCLHKAVLELIYRDQDRKQKTASQVAIEGVVYDTINTAAMMELSELPVESLYRFLTSDFIVPCIVKFCELFTESIHTNYLITQWHRLPFDERNNDINFLHRSSLNSFDQSFNGESAMKTLSAGSDDDVLSSNKIKEQVDKLNQTYIKLCDSRGTLWENVIDTFIEMLSDITLTSTVSLEDFIVIVWSIRAVLKLGTEFCDSQFSSRGRLLVSQLEEKAMEYFRNTHYATFNLLLQILEADPWSIVPVRISEYGSINKLILSKVGLTKNDSSLIKLVARGEGTGMKCLRTKIREDFEKDKEKTAAKESASSIDSATTIETTQDGESVDQTAQILMYFAQNGNPFQRNPHETISSSQKSIDVSIIINDIFDDEISNPVSKKAQQMNDTMVVTQSILNGLAKYSGRYLQMMNIMPCIAIEAFQSLCQLFDFYLCFAYHGFLPQEERSKFLAKFTKMSLPVPDQGRDFETLRNYLEQSMTTILMKYPATDNDSQGAAAAGSGGVGGVGEGGNGESNSINNSNPNSNFGNEDSSRTFASLLRLPAMVELEEESGFFGLNNRIVAGESCWFAARILLDIKPRLLRCLPPTHSALCDQYINQFQLIASQLRSLINKSMCPMLIHQNWFLTQMNEVGGWDSKKLKDTHHEFIDQIVTYCLQVWNYMASDDYFGDASSIVREQVWLELCQCAFDTLLDGFARAKKVSPEGRAAMAMDVTALHDGLDSIHACRTPRGKHHVDNFLQAMYLSEEDLMNWVNENWQSYAYRHIYGLFAQTLTSVLNPKKLRDAIAVIDALYEVETKCTDSKSEEFNWQKLKDGTGDSISAITQKLRRQSMFGGGS